VQKPYLVWDETDQNRYSTFDQNVSKKKTLRFKAGHKPSRYKGYPAPLLGISQVNAFRSVLTMKTDTYVDK